MARSVTARKRIVVTQEDRERLLRLADTPMFRRDQGRLGPLQAELSGGACVPSAKVPKDVVTMRSRVQVRDLTSQQLEEYELVYPEEADIEYGRLSVLSPLGTALLGARVGQVVTVAAPAGQRRIQIEELLYQPEAAGDYHL